MGSKSSRHKISFSALPRSVFLAPRGSTLQLAWNRKEMTRRLKFVLGLMSEDPVSVHIEFVDVLEMGSLNWQFRGKDRPTDVLSFMPHQSAKREVYAGHSGPHGMTNLGEIAVCIEVCAAQAKSHRCSLAREIETMLIHGLVHLKGFDHERSEAAYTVMTLLERGVRAQLNSAFGEPNFCSGKLNQDGKQTLRSNRRTRK